MAKTEIIKFRVTPEEKEILEEKAYGSYRTMSRYLRDCALGKEIIVVVPGADCRGRGKEVAIKAQHRGKENSRAYGKARPEEKRPATNPPRANP